MQPLKILFSAMSSQGHVNACIAIAELLAPRGHEITFALPAGWRELVEKHNFKFIEIVVNEPDNDYNCACDDEKNGINGSDDKNENVINTNGVNGHSENGEDTKNNDVKDVKDKRATFLTDYVSTMLTEVRHKTWDRLKNLDEKWVNLNCKLFAFLGALDEPLACVMDSVKPDLVVVDTLFWLPCLMKTTTPWISLWSSNPLLIYNDLPPFGSGLPTRGPKSEWDRFDSINSEKCRPVHEHNRRWLAKRGIIVTEEKPKYHLFESPFMNIYNYPEILDYSDIGQKPEKWFRIDSAVREADEKNPFKIPENLVSKPGKLIYFSLGSMASIDLELMKRVLGCLAKSPHRFIVSKGPLHEQIDLADNMWGDRYVNQIGILPHVDLVITHGGNNTLTESLYFGKPVIVMPICFDQHDNAQRIVEKGLGLRVETYHFQDHELLEAIEKILNDDEIYGKLADVKERLRASSTRDQVCQLIEQTAFLKKCPL